MKPYLAAALQMNSIPDLEKNLNQAEDLIDLAVRRGAELIGLPENFAFLGDEEKRVVQAETIARESEKFLKVMAQKYQVMILGGGYPVPASPGKAYNTALLVGRNGQELARYEKVHLFDVNLPDGNTYQESGTMVAGKQMPPVYPSKELGHLGLSVCYDVRFPELYRHLSQMGAEVLFVPAAFTAYTGKDHWQVLLKARAIENTCPCPDGETQHHAPISRARHDCGSLGCGASGCWRLTWGSRRHDRSLSAGAGTPPNALVATPCLRLRAMCGGF